MNNTRFEQNENRPSAFDNRANQAADAFRQQALLLYQCRDGSIVTNPTDCRMMNQASYLPNLEIVSDTNSQIAGNAVRNNGAGTRESERAATLDRRST